MRMTGLEIEDVQARSLEPFALLDETLAQRGIEVTTFAELLSVDPGAWQKLGNTNLAAQFDWPDPDPRPDAKPHEPETVDQFRRGPGTSA